MTFLPIAVREMQVSARRPMTYYWRCLCALNAGCVTLACLLAGFAGALSAASAGELTFRILSLAGYGIAAVAAALMTADCISQERREGTLGLLFLTDLRGYDIIVGKLARLGAPIYCLAAAFPALGFTLLLGGVSLGDFAGVALALLNTLFFYAAFGLLVSARSWNGGSASSSAMLGVLAGSAPMVAALAGLDLPGAGLAMLFLTPAGAFLSALEPASSAVSRPDFLPSLAASHALGWLFIAAAGRVVMRPLSGGEDPRQPASARRPRAREADPVAAFYSRSAPRQSWRLVLLLAGLAAMIALTSACISSTQWFDIPTFLGIMVGLHLILKYCAANSACRALPSRRKSGELEILLTTPLDGDAILSGSITAIKRQLLRPFLFVLAMDGLLLVLGWCKLGPWEGFLWAGAVCLEVLWFIGNLYTLTWLGLFMGLKSSSHAKALGSTLFDILLLPWSALALAAALVGVSTMGRNIIPDMTLVTVAEFFVAQVVCNLLFAGWAVSELRDHFRLLAAHHLPPSQPLAWPWKSIFKQWRWRVG
jgi:hypothetical protein